jgi:hypothetical protein
MARAVARLPAPYRVAASFSWFRASGQRSSVRIGPLPSEPSAMLAKALSRERGSRGDFKRDYLQHFTSSAHDVLGALEKALVGALRGRAPRRSRPPVPEVG